MTSESSYDENGYLKGFAYHDGYLDGVVVGNQGERLQLALRASTGDRRILTLRGLAALHVQNFREGNVVLNMRVLSSEDSVKNAEIREALATRLFLDPSQLKDGRRVFVLEGSFGADVIAIFRDIEISESGMQFIESRNGPI